MSISQIISRYSKILKSSSPVLDVELLLTKALNNHKEYLYRFPEKKLTTAELSKFKKLFARRQKGEPIAYILGSKEFYGLNFKVNKNVLIPRPETEQLVEQVIKYAKNKKLKIADIGVGSGAIIISSAKNLNGQFFGTDISKKALSIAKQNAKIHQVKINFYQGNLLEPLNNKKIDIITANLPYLDKAEKILLPSSDTKGLKFEPKIAWDGGSDGLDYYRKFFKQTKKFKIRPKAIFLEIGHNQALEIKKLARQALPQYKFKIKKDLCGFDRLLILNK